MYISVFMGPFARGPRDDRPLIELCLEHSVRAAEAGFAMVTFGEQHFNNYEPYCNPFLMGARLAPFLKDTWFGTTIVPLPLHHPVRLAEDINILDQLLGGKLIVGLSAGRVGFSPDFENFGLDPKDRDQIFATKLDLLKRLWNHGPADGPIRFDTPWDKGGMHGRLMPTAYRAPKPLHAIGTNTDATIERVGRDGDIVFLGPCMLRDAAAKFTLYRRALREGGLDEAAVEDRVQKSLVLHHVIVGETEDEAWARAERQLGGNPLMNRANDPRTLRQMSEVDLTAPGARDDPNWRNAEHVQSWVIAGNPESVAAQLLAHEAAGIPHVHTRFTIGAYNPEDMNRSMQLFIDEVMPRINPQRFAPPTGDTISEAVRQGPLPAGARPPGLGPAGKP